MVHITHSIPEMHGLMIRTPTGNVFHTGDWKLDAEPVIGNPTDENKLQKLGNEGVLAMVSDSTNIFNPGSSGSEGELKKKREFNKLIRKVLERYDDCYNFRIKHRTSLFNFNGCKRNW